MAKEIIQGKKVKDGKLVKDAIVIWQFKYGQEIFRAVKHKQNGKHKITFEQHSGYDSIGNDIWLEPETQEDLDLLKQAFSHWFLIGCECSNKVNKKTITDFFTTKKGE